MGWGRETDDLDVGDAGGSCLGVVLDFVFLLVELAFAKEVVDGFVILSLTSEKLFLNGLNRDILSQEIDLPSCIPNLCSSYVLRHGKLARQREGSFLHLFPTDETN